MAGKESVSQIVSKHYNEVEETGLYKRSKSRIYYMRNLNNWIKSVIIDESLSEVERSREAVILDLGCGKGGDFFKWKVNNVKHLCCIDVAEVCIEHCKNRYKGLGRGGRDRNLFSCEFHVLDFTRDDIPSLISGHNKFDIVSCQFAFHYSFESLEQAERILKTISECLKPGGIFVGTTTDAVDIVKRVRRAGGKRCGNNIYSIDFEFDAENPPLFGAKYHFHLSDVVDCPEFLVYFPCLIHLAKKYNLEFMYKKRFHQIVTESTKLSKYKNLLTVMKALECYSEGTTDLSSSDPNDYDHAREVIKHSDMSSHATVGTISSAEYDAISLYAAFAFRKI